MIDSERDETAEVLTLTSCAMPNGFACLAASVLASLREHREVYLFLGEDDTINFAVPPEIAHLQAPTLMIPVSALDPEKMTEDGVQVPLQAATMVKKVFAEAANAYDPPVSHSSHKS